MNGNLIENNKFSALRFSLSCKINWNFVVLLNLLHFNKTFWDIDEYRVLINMC